MQISLSEYAKDRGISIRRARAMAESGAIKASRIGRSWVVDDSELAARRRLRGRPMSPVMAWHYIHAMSGEKPVEIRDAERARIRERLARLSSSDAPIDLIHSWLAHRAALEEFSINRADLEDLRADARVVPSGISDSRAGLSSASEFEGYIAAEDLADVRKDYLLARSSSPNVRLHVADKPVQRPAPIALVIADLADRNGPREDARAEELIRSWIQ
jgi:hypothetical protein